MKCQPSTERLLSQTSLRKTRLRLFFRVVDQLIKCHWQPSGQLQCGHHHSWPSNASTFIAMILANPQEMFTLTSSLTDEEPSVQERKENQSRFSWKAVTWLELKFTNPISTLRNLRGLRSTFNTGRVHSGPLENQNISRGIGEYQLRIWCQDILGLSPVTLGKFLKLSSPVSLLLRQE